MPLSTLGKLNPKMILVEDNPKIPTQKSGTLPTSAGTLPTSAGTLPTSAGTLPTSAGTLPISAGTLPLSSLMGLENFIIQDLNS